MIVASQLYTEVKLKGLNIAALIATVSSFIAIGPRRRTRPTQPLALYRRICILRQNEKSLENYFKFERSPHPLSLFDDSGTRKNKKSEL